MKKDCLISVEGGLGKNVMLTSVLPILKNKYENIYVVSPYHDVFKACSYVEDAFQMGQGSLYQELVLRDDVDILWKEPYSNQRFIKKQCHLFEAWLEEFGIEIPENFNAMDLTPNVDNIAEAYPNVKEMADKAKEKIGGEYIIVQFCGGQSPLANNFNQMYDDKQEGIKRNYYKAQELINELHKKYPDKKIIHYSLPNEPKYENSEKLELPYLAYIELAKDAFKVVCTDSSLQHIAAGNCKDVTVIWGETRPEHFGYNCNKNICAKNVINSQPYFKPLGVSPSIVKMPSVKDVMDYVDAIPVSAEDLQKAINEQLKKPEEIKKEEKK